MRRLAADYELGLFGLQLPRRLALGAFDGLIRGVLDHVRQPGTPPGCAVERGPVLASRNNTGQDSKLLPDLSWSSSYALERWRCSRSPKPAKSAPIPMTANERLTTLQFSKASGRATITRTSAAQ